MNKRIPNEIALGIIIFVAIIIGGLIWLATVDRRKQVELATQPIARKQTQSKICPDDAKLCPDGTSVGRVGADCEFAECPAVSEEKPSYPLLLRPVSKNGVKVEIILGDKLCSYEQYPNMGYQQSIKVSYEDNSKKEKIIYTTSGKINNREMATYTENDCLFLESIGSLILSPDGKYLIFNKNGWESSKPYMINIKTEKYVFGDKDNIFIIRDILWSPNNKNFVVTTDVNEMSGGGEMGVYVSEYNNPDKIREIWIAKIYLLADIKEVNFIGDDKISFIIEQSECPSVGTTCPDGTHVVQIGPNCEFEDCAIKNKAKEASKKIIKYEYNFKEGELSQIK